MPKSWVWWRADFQSGSRVLKKVFWTFSYLYLWHIMWFRVGGAAVLRFLESPLFPIYKGMNALYWPSHINHHLVPPHTDSVPPSTKYYCPILDQYTASLSPRNAQMSQLDLDILDTIWSKILTKYTWTCSKMIRLSTKTSLRITLIYYGPGACIYSAQHATTGARTQWGDKSWQFSWQFMPKAK